MVRNVLDGIPFPGKTDASPSTRYCFLASDVRLVLAEELPNAPSAQQFGGPVYRSSVLIDGADYDRPIRGRYTVRRYLDDVNKQYGGIDNSNSYDLFDDLPSGRIGVRGMVEEFHHAGVRVLFPVFTWDQGTRASGKAAWDAISQILADVDADGINGDSLAGFPRNYWLASDRLNHPLVLEPGSGTTRLCGLRSSIWSRCGRNVELQHHDMGLLELRVRSVDQP